MRICLLGEFYGELDEAMRIISFNLAKELKKTNEVLTLDLREAFKKDFWRILKQYKPDLVHYVHGGSIKSFALLKMIKKLTFSRTILSVMRFTKLPPIVRFLKPDLILAQSDFSENYFRRLGFKVKFLPIGGVDLEKFNPELRKKKEELREKYRIDKEKFVILHVGSIKKGRNIHIFKRIQQQEPDIQVLIIGPVSVGMQKNLVEELKKAGCIVFPQYIEQIEEFYALSDCYVFPVLPKFDFIGRNLSTSIDIPLSVLEAMACNLPVITTKFGGLMKMFKSENGLFFIENLDEIIFIVRELLQKNQITINNFEKVKNYSWSKIVNNLINIYYNILEGEIYAEK